MFLLLAYFSVASVLLVGGTLFYYVLFPDLAAERFGEREALPPDVGIWRPDMDTPEAVAAHARGLVREVRTFHQEGGGAFRRRRLLLQARYRNVETRAIVSVERDKVVKLHRADRR